MRAVPGLEPKTGGSRRQTPWARAVGIALFIVGLTVVGFIPPAVSAAPHTSTTATPTTTEATDAAPISVSLTGVSPSVVHPTSTLTVVASLTNTSDRLEFNGTATLSIERVLMLTRSSVSAWTDRNYTDPVGSALQQKALDLSPGETATVTFTVKAANLGLLATSEGWGPRGIAVSADGSLRFPEGAKAEDSTTTKNRATSPVTGQLGVGRSFMLWQPVKDSEITPVSVAVSVPVTGLTSTLDQDAKVGGRLDRLVAATGNTSAATWVVDPALLATDESNNTSQTDTAAQAWASRLLSQVKGREVYALPVFDTDAELTTTTSTALQPSASLANKVSTITQGWRHDLTLPAADAPTRKSVVAAAAKGGGAVIARSGYQPSDDLTYTPNGVTTVTSQGKQATVLVADTVLTELFTNPGDTTPAAAAQRLLAELAVISRERPAQARSVLIALPRTWQAQPQIASAQFAALDGAAWSRSIPLSTLAATTPDEIDRQIPKTAERTDALTKGEWDEAVDKANRATTFAKIAADAESISGPIRDSTLELASVAFESDPAGRQKAQTTINASVGTLLRSQSVVIGSNVNLISAAGSLPVTLRNDLDQDVTLTVKLAPDDPRLKAEPLKNVTVRAQSQTSVEIPVTAVGSGDVTVDVRLIGAGGEILATPASFDVRVRAGWETLGTAIIGGVLALGLIFGIWRTIRRGRARSRTTSTVTSEDV